MSNNSYSFKIRQTRQMDDLMLQNARDPEIAGIRQLLASVLLRTMLDLKEQTVIKNWESSDIVKQARIWVNSESFEPYSFKWICEHLDLDHKIIREGMLNFKYERKRIKWTF